MCGRLGPSREVLGTGVAKSSSESESEGDRSLSVVVLGVRIGFVLVEVSLEIDGWFERGLCSLVVAC